MATQYKEDPEHKLVELVVDGKVTKEDFDHIATQMEAFIASHGKIKVLEDIRKFSGFELPVLWDGIKFDIQHLKDISHCAVVSDMGWVGPFSKAFGVFISCKIRTFPHDKIEEARQWLLEK
ncbi:MAG: STAS/SEC14 domain-containing protein [Pseudomonadota bacterium]